jgi:hypothetical protein
MQACKMRATQRGDFMGLPLTARRMEFACVLSFELADGLIARERRDSVAGTNRLNTAATSAGSAQNGVPSAREVTAWHASSGSIAMLGCCCLGFI